MKPVRVNVFITMTLCIMGYVHGAIQQRCFPLQRVNDYDTPGIEVTSNHMDTQVLVYPIKAIHNTSIPKLVSDSVIGTRDSGLRVCTQELFDQGACEGKDKGSFLYTIDQGSDIGKQIHEELIEAGSTRKYSIDGSVEGGVYCVLSCQGAGNLSYVDGVDIKARISKGMYRDFDLVMELDMLLLMNMPYIFSSIAATLWIALETDNILTLEQIQPNHAFINAVQICLFIDQLYPMTELPTYELFDIDISTFLQLSKKGVVMLLGGTLTLPFMDAERMKVFLTGGVKQVIVQAFMLSLYAFFSALKCSVLTLHTIELTAPWAESVDWCCQVVLGVVTILWWLSVYIFTMLETYRSRTYTPLMKHKVRVTMNSYLAIVIGLSLISCAVQIKGQMSSLPGGDIYFYLGQHLLQFIYGPERAIEYDVGLTIHSKLFCFFKYLPVFTPLVMLFALYLIWFSKEHWTADDVRLMSCLKESNFEPLNNISEEQLEEKSSEKVPFSTESDDDMV